jgi:excisionase family DNA binding protein
MSDTQVRASVLKFLVDELARRDLVAALTQVAWDEAESDVGRALANRVLLAVDEYSAGACDDRQLRAALRPFVTMYTVRLVLGAPLHEPVRARADSGSSVTRTPTGVGTRFGGVYGCDTQTSRPPARGFRETETGDVAVTRTERGVTPMEQDPPLRAAQAATALGLSLATIRVWIREGRIGYVRLGRSIRIPTSEITRLLTDGFTPAHRPERVR